MLMRYSHESDLVLDASFSSEKGEMLNIIENVGGAHDYVLDMAKQTVQTLHTDIFIPVPILVRYNTENTRKVGCRTVAAIQCAR